MKIIHSLWTKPSKKKKNLNVWDRSKGGWVERKYNYMSWALSCLQFRKFYKEVELVTDKEGYELLINKLNLPYTDVKIVLDNLNGYHPDLWAIGKLYTYSIQDSPFLHVDGDVFIWDKLPSKFDSAPLIVQNIEYENPDYHILFRSLKDKFKYMPKELFAAWERNKKVMSVNAGVMGGNDIDFFKRYTETAFRFVNDNYDDLSKIEIANFNLIYEQNLFFALADSENLPIVDLLGHINQEEGLVEFTEVPDKTKYIHTISVYKKLEYVGNHLAKQLQATYPEYYFKIMNLLHSYQL